MFKIGLSGGRYSGKDRISKLFKQILVPVFNADAVLTFILHYDFKLLGELKGILGETYFKSGALDFEFLKKNTEKFELFLDYVEPVILQSYHRFEEKNKNSIYTIFHYSLLFERGLNKKMDKNIAVFAPDNIRFNRALLQTRADVLKLDKLVKSEMPALDKNTHSDFVIHNYEVLDVYDAVCDTDKKIVDLYLRLQSTKKVEVVNKNFIKIR